MKECNSDERGEVENGVKEEKGRKRSKTVKCVLETKDECVGCNCHTGLDSDS